MADETISFKPLAWLRADYRQKFGIPRQGSHARASRAVVELAPEWRGRGILSGLEGFSHVWLISHLHLSVSKRQRGKVHPPRLGGAKIGVMGSRSPHRPNNIGLTLARVLRCQGDVLEVGEIDLVDGTPLLDLKPYLPAADRPESFASGWTDGAIKSRSACTFTEVALAELSELGREKLIADTDRIRALIEEMISLDPRPPAYLGRAHARFAIWVSGLNVVFEFAEGAFTVTRIERA